MVTEGQRAPLLDKITDCVHDKLSKQCVEIFEITSILNTSLWLDKLDFERSLYAMVRALSPRDAADRLAAGRLELIDVREVPEWAGGHVPGARCVPLALLRANPRSAFASDGVVFVCAAGVRSEAAARLALSMGLTEVYNLTGGTRAWAKAGLPLVREEVVTAAE